MMSDCAFQLDMRDWHGDNDEPAFDPSCSTTHCRGGWAVWLGGEAGCELEWRLNNDTEMAGALIYAASRPGQPIPYFYASNEGALADLRRGAVEASR